MPIAGGANRAEKAESTRGQPARRGLASLIAVPWGPPPSAAVCRSLSCHHHGRKRPQASARQSLTNLRRQGRCEAKRVDGATESSFKQSTRGIRLAVQRGGQVRGGENDRGRRGRNPGLPAIGARGYRCGVSV